MNSPNGILNLMGAIVFVALVTTIVAHPGTKGVITSGSAGFANAIRAAQGR